MPGFAVRPFDRKIRVERTTIFRLAGICVVTTFVAKDLLESHGLLFVFLRAWKVKRKSSDFLMSDRFFLAQVSPIHGTGAEAPHKRTPLSLT